MRKTDDFENLLLIICNNGNIMNWSIRTMCVNGFITMFCLVELSFNDYSKTVFDFKIRSDSCHPKLSASSSQSLKSNLHSLRAAVNLCLLVNHFHLIRNSYIKNVLYHKVSTTLFSFVQLLQMTPQYTLQCCVPRMFSLD